MGPAAPEEPGGMEGAGLGWNLQLTTLHTVGNVRSATPGGRPLAVKLTSMSVIPVLYKSGGPVVGGTFDLDRARPILLAYIDYPCIHIAQLYKIVFTETPFVSLSRFPVPPVVVLVVLVRF